MKMVCKYCGCEEFSYVNGEDFGDYIVEDYDCEGCENYVTVISKKETVKVLEQNENGLWETYCEFKRNNK